VSFELWEHKEGVICDRHEVLRALTLLIPHSGTWRHAVSHKFIQRIFLLYRHGVILIRSQCGSHMSLRKVCEFILDYQPTILETTFSLYVYVAMHSTRFLIK